MKTNNGLSRSHSLYHKKVVAIAQYAGNDYELDGWGFFIPY